MITKEQHTKIQEMRDTDKPAFKIYKAIKNIDPSFDEAEQSIFMWLKRNKP